MADNGWQREFKDPVPLPGGRRLVTLKDAAAYIQKLPKAEHGEPHWQTATEVLIMAAEGKGPVMHARIGMLQAINHGKPAPEREPRRKAVKAYRIVR